MIMKGKLLGFQALFCVYASGDTPYPFAMEQTCTLRSTEMINMFTIMML